MSDTSKYHNIMRNINHKLETISKLQITDHCVLSYAQSVRSAIMFEESLTAAQSVDPATVKILSVLWSSVCCSGDLKMMREYFGLDISIGKRTNMDGTILGIYKRKIRTCENLSTILDLYKLIGIYPQLKCISPKYHGMVVLTIKSKKLNWRSDIDSLKMRGDFMPHMHYLDATEDNIKKMQQDIETSIHDICEQVRL